MDLSVAMEHASVSSSLNGNRRGCPLGPAGPPPGTAAMYHISRQIYRELAADLSPADREHVLRACENAVVRLVTDRHYFARPSQTLFAEVRWRFPLAAQGRVFAVIDRHLRETRAYLETSNRATLELGGTSPTCRATTRRRGLCSHAPDPRTGYCRWHRHLVEDERMALAG